MYCVKVCVLHSFSIHSSKTAVCSLSVFVYVFTSRLNNTQTASFSPDVVRWGSEVHHKHTHTHTYIYTHTHIHTHTHTHTCSSLSAASNALAGDFQPRILFSFYLIYWPSHKEIQQLKAFILFNIWLGGREFRYYSFIYISSSQLDFSFSFHRPKPSTHLSYFP